MIIIKASYYVVVRSMHLVCFWEMNDETDDENDAPFASFFRRY